MVLGKLINHVWKNETSTLSNTITKIKWIKDLNVRPKTIKLLRGNHRQNTLWHKSQQDPLWLTSQSNGNTNTNKQKGPNFTSMLLHNEGNYKQGEKAAFRMGENSSKQNNWPRINLQNIQAAHKAQYQKNDPIKKWEEDLNRDFSKKTHRRLTNTWKDVQHHSLLEKCKSKTQWDIISHRSEWPSSKTLQRINAEEGVEKRNTGLTNCF